MSIDDTEASVDEASPREGFLFTCGEQEFALTGSDETLRYGSRTYERASIARTEIEQSQEDGAGGMTISLPAVHPLAQRFIGIAPTIPTRVTVLRVHRNGGASIQFVGRITQASFIGQEAQLACMPEAGVLSRKVPTLIYHRQCNWATYGPGCGVDKELFRVAATIETVDGLRIRSSAFAAKPDGWFTYGYVELTVGDRTGDRRFVLAHVGEQLTLNAPFVALMAGESVNAFAGDDRTEATCAGKFNNLDRHMGFARIPTTNPYHGRVV